MSEQDRPGSSRGKTGRRGGHRARSRVEEALRASMRNHRAIFSTHGSGAVWLDAERAAGVGLRPSTRRFSNLLGYTADQVMGRSAFDRPYHRTNVARLDGSD
jgi:hypothetical protein